MEDFPLMSLTVGRSDFKGQIMVDFVNADDDRSYPDHRYAVKPLAKRAESATETSDAETFGSRLNEVVEAEFVGPIVKLALSLED